MWTRYIAISWTILVARLHPVSGGFGVSSSRRFAARRCDTTRLWNESPKNLSASAKERRDEEKRRLERKTDVVISKTSARPEEQDYPLRIQETEEQYLRQASDVEQEIFRETDRGMQQLKMLQLEEATESFARVFELKPNAYLWQAGIAKFYLDELESAADIFVRNAATYESKFGEPATEERIWRDACQLKHGLDEIAQIPERDEDDPPLPTETRKVLRIARDLFTATLEGNHAAEVLARAKLRSICGSSPTADRKMWKLTAWYYLGLHYDVIGDEEESKKCMKMALRLCPSSGNADDIIHTLPLLHMARRDLFDDDEFEDDTKENASNDSPGSSRVTSLRTDPVFIDSIRSSISKMRLVELQSALKARGLKYHDSKEALGEKLFRSLLEDSGLDG